MDKSTLISIVKRYKFIYTLYFWFGSFILGMMGKIIRANKKIVLFVCSGGREYGDNVRPIYEAMIDDRRFDDWTFVWAFRDDSHARVKKHKRCKECRIDSIKFYYLALCAKCWITNVSVQRGLYFKNKGTTYINTWHGVPIKKIGNDIKSKDVFKMGKVEQYDLMFAAGKYDAKIYKSAFNMKEEDIYITGYPRNDKMFKNSNKYIKRVRDLYNVDPSKKIILYAPTYRDYVRDSSGRYLHNFVLSPSKFKKTMGDGYVLFVRSHELVENKIATDSNVVDVTDYPDVEDLMLASDFLISDYSGIIFDYSLLNKPIVLYQYDIEEYERRRGFYVDIAEFLPFSKCSCEEEIYKLIKSVDLDLEKTKDVDFVKKCGIKKIATNNVINIIYERIKDK